MLRERECVCERKPYPKRKQRKEEQPRRNRLLERKNRSPKTLPRRLTEQRPPPTQTSHCSRARAEKINEIYNRVCIENKGRLHCTLYVHWLSTSVRIWTLHSHSLSAFHSFVRSFFWNCSFVWQVVVAGVQQFKNKESGLVLSFLEISKCYCKNYRFALYSNNIHTYIYGEKTAFHGNTIDEHKSGEKESERDREKDLNFNWFEVK